MTASSPGHDSTQLRLSFVIPTRNRTEQVQAAVAKVLAQTRSPDEVIVVDDGSSPAVVAGDGLDDARVRLVHLSHAGAGAARNAGVQAASGDVLVFLDDDDDLEPQWVEKMLRPLEADGTVAVVCCGATLRRTDTGARRDSPVRVMGQPFKGVRGNFDTGTYAVRRAAFVEAGGFAAGLASGEHHEMAIRLIDVVLAHGWRIATVDEPLVTIHQRPSSLRSSNLPRQQYDSAMYMLDHHGAVLGSRGRATYLAIAAVSVARLDDFPQARALLRQSVRASRTRWQNYARLALATIRPLGRRVWKVDEWRNATAPP